MAACHPHGFHPRIIDSLKDKKRNLVTELADSIAGEVRFSHHDRMLYATDASMYQVEPLGVVIPRNTDDIQTTIRWVVKHDKPLLARVGGTSLVGQAVNAAVIIDLSRHCNRFLEVDLENRIATVEPGLVLDHLNQKLQPHGLMFGPDVATSTHAGIGGMIGNNSSGAHSILYGRTVDHLRSVDVILADGSKVTLAEGSAVHDSKVGELTRKIVDVITPLRDEIRKRFPQTLRRVNGYNLDLILDQLENSSPGTFDRVNLAHLICGSEGTLGVMTKATLDLVEIPPHKGLGIIAFPQVDDALLAVNEILKIKPAAVELIDNIVLDLARQNREHRHHVELLPDLNGTSAGAVLYVEYFAQNEAEIADQLSNLTRQFGESATHIYTGTQEMANAWALRKAGEPLLHGLIGKRKPVAFIEDTAVEPQNLPEYITELRELISRHGTKAAFYAHASVGCLHVRPLLCLHEDVDRQTMQAIAEDTTDLVKHYAGALSGEHGDGRARSHLLRRFYGSQICDAFARIKKIFDPDNRFNPGNIVDPPAMTHHLRVHPNENKLIFPEADTAFRFDDGFNDAIERCNGAGLCRKARMEDDPDDSVGEKVWGGGEVMCPSFRATRDERHSTRGRGNALRLAITGQLSSPGGSEPWLDQHTLDTLDLCLSCKACKRECPSNVDIAKLKAEYIHQGHKAKHHIPWQRRLMGNVRRINSIGSAVAPLANLTLRHTPFGSIAKQALGIHPERRLPQFHKSLFRWFNKRKQPTVLDPSAPAVILFPDCFTIYQEPHIGQAAVHVLESLGYRVILPCVGCCGRSYISSGMLDHAITVCSQTAQQLHQIMQNHQVDAIVVCEPSCASAMRDDWLDLKLTCDDSVVSDVSRNVMMIDEFIESSQHPTPPHTIEITPERESTVPILLHGHCHQKALWGIDATVKLLQRFLKQDITVLDSSCCGLAGAWGYAHHRHELSLQIGEQSLFTTFRQNPEAIVAATGTSCRQQILDGLQRKAFHPIELIAQSVRFEN